LIYFSLGVIIRPPTVETVGYGNAVNIFGFYYTVANGFNRWECGINLDNGKKAQYFLFSPDSSENPCGPEFGRQDCNE
jgi:hypothetical protein